MPLLGLPLNRCAESSSTKSVKSLVIPGNKHFRLLDKNEDSKNSLNKSLRDAAHIHCLPDWLGRTFNYS